jgi:transposase-like protein
MARAGAGPLAAGNHDAAQAAPRAVPVMEAARDDVFSFLHFPQEHWRKIWSTNPLERLNKETKRRTNGVGYLH